MGISDKIGKVARKALDLAGQHPEQVEKVLDQAERALDAQTGGKYHHQVETAGEKAESMLAREATKRNTGTTPAPDSTEH